MEQNKLLYYDLKPHAPLVALLVLLAVAAFAYNQYGKVTTILSTADAASIVAPPATCNFYASPSGSPSGDGSEGSPWEINTALGQGSNLSGQTLCLRGGLYNARLTSNLINATVRSAPGEWAKFDSYIHVTLLTSIGPDSGAGNPCTFDDLGHGVTIGDPGGGIEFSDGDDILIHNPSGNSANCLFNENSHAAGSVGIARGGPFMIYGSDTVYRDFEVYDSNPVRVYPAGGDPGHQRSGDIVVYGPRTKIVNMVIHDIEDGIFGAVSATDSEFYGNVIFNNGLSDPIRGHGHGLYLQNQDQTKPKKVIDVISFNNFAFGMKAFGESGPANGFEFDGVISFNNGSSASFPGNPSGYSANTRMSNLFIGPASTDNPATEILLENNRTYNVYNAPGGVGAGYAGVRNNDIVVQNNYFVDSFGLNYWLDAVVTGNTIVNNSSDNSLMGYSIGATDSWVFNNNQYFDLHDPFENGTIYDIHLDIEGQVTANGLGGGILAYTETPNVNGKGWKEWTGFDANSTYTLGAPTTNEIFIRPNQYEQGRANIAVYNWTNSSTVNANLSSIGLQDGQAYKIVKADNYFGNPIYTGTYNSSSPTVGLDMTDTTIVGPIGLGFTPASTCPEFCVFVVLPTTEDPSDTTPPSSGGGGGGGGATNPNPQTSLTHLINSQGTYYLVTGGFKKGITSPGILYSCGFEFKDAKIPTTADLTLPTSMLLPCDGALVKSSVDQTVYLISNGQRYAFTSAQVFFELGFKFSSVLLVTNPELQTLPKSSDISNGASAHLPGLDVNFNGTVYWVDANLTKHAYPSLEVYNSWHRDGDFSTVVPANAADLNLTTGSNVPMRVVQ